jgi:eukaryotic-like serine/threonine-protein kinase
MEDNAHTRDTRAVQTDPVTVKEVDPTKQIKRCPECNQHLGVDATFCPFDGTRLELSAYEAPVDPLVGSVIDGRYEVRGPLGEGGMGTVYEVRHRALGRSFAMKVLRRDVAREKDLSERFINEAKATASLRHPHIVSITDFGKLADTTPFFVMEMLVGHTLAAVLKSGPIPANRVSRILLQVASALGAAHEAGVVHRDLKPENVFLARPTGPRAADLEDDVKIVDFGAAKVLGASRITKTGIVFGTPHYMSPEQASGQPVDHRADIYAFGVIMYEMLAGRVPFEADTYMGVLTQHMFVQPKPPSIVRPELAGQLGSLEEITLRALEKRPEDRYQTMTGLAADLEKAARGEAVEKMQRPSAVSLPPGSVSRLATTGPSTNSGSISVVAGLRQASPLRGPVLLGILVGACIVGVVALVRGSRVTPASAVAPAATSGPLAAAAPVPPPPPPATTTAPPPPVASAPSSPPTSSARAAAAVPSPRAAGPVQRAPAPDRTPPRRSPGGELADPWAK